MLLLLIYHIFLNKTEIHTHTYTVISIYLSIYLSVCQSVCLSVCLPACLSVCLSTIYIYINTLSFKSSTNNINYLSTNLSVYKSIYITSITYFMLLFSFFFCFLFDYNSEFSSNTFHLCEETIVATSKYLHILFDLTSFFEHALTRFQCFQLWKLSVSILLF